MKKFFFLVVALIVAVVSFAQNTLVATLSHGDAVKMFFGPSALINANDEAENGDVITLSGGTFACPNFTKGITIRGTGVNTENPTTIAYVSGIQEYNTIDIPQNENCRFSMEGCIVQLKWSSDRLNILGKSSNIYFLKCQLSYINYTSSGNANFVNCEISTFDLSGSGIVKFTNCYLYGFKNASNDTSKAEFLNSLYSGNGYETAINRSSFINTILFTNGTHNDSFAIPAETQAMNCLVIGNDLNNVASAVDCFTVEASTATSIFKTYSSRSDRWGTEWFPPTAPYELTDEAKTKYLGTDGKEIGLYGGQYPFNLTPNYPRITKLNVAKQTTADNKLSVDIEVSATE